MAKPKAQEPNKVVKIVVSCSWCKKELPNQTELANHLQKECVLKRQKDAANRARVAQAAQVAQDAQI